MTQKPRLAILGMGYLMTYLKPCYHHLFGDELSGNISAMTRTAASAAEKEKQMGFPVICGNYLPTLRSAKPDIILFSPPPSAAKEMTEAVLMPYFDELRANAQPLPDLYIFPPAPTGDYYLQMLGTDVCAVQILPNMSAYLNGRDIHTESYTILTFADKSVWSQESLARLTYFFEPLGYILEVPLNRTTQCLGSFICSHVTQELAMVVADGLHLRKEAVASCMRARLLERSGRRFPNALACSRNAVPEELQELTSLCIDSWVNGMLRFNKEAEIDDTLSKAIVYPQTDIFLQNAQELSEDEIKRQNTQHATKGGILEKGLATFFSPGVAHAISRILHQQSGNILSLEERKNIVGLIENSAYLISKNVAAHGAVFGN